MPELKKNFVRTVNGNIAGITIRQQSSKPYNAPETAVSFMKIRKNTAAQKGSMNMIVFSFFNFVFYPFVAFVIP